MGIRRAWRVWRYKRKVRAFVDFFGILDTAISHNVPRWKRRQFWRDFWKSDEFRRAMKKKLPSLLLRGLK